MITSSKHQLNPSSLRRSNKLPAILALAGLYVAVSPSPSGQITVRLAGLALAGLGYAFWLRAKKSPVPGDTPKEVATQPLPSRRSAAQPISVTGSFIPPIRQPRPLYVHSFAFPEPGHLQR